VVADATTGSNKWAEQLYRQKTFYEKLFAAQSELGEGLLIVEGGCIVYANDAFVDVSGYTQEELVRLPTRLDLFVEGERSFFSDLLGLLRSRGRVASTPQPLLSL
jgi:PAS domain S-box-containing protein